MPTTSHGPKLQKGAIVAIDLADEQANGDRLSIHPEKLTHTIKPGQMGPSGAERQRAIVGSL